MSHTQKYYLVKLVFGSQSLPAREAEWLASQPSNRRCWVRILFRYIIFSCVTNFHFISYGKNNDENQINKTEKKHQTITSIISSRKYWYNFTVTNPKLNNFIFMIFILSIKEHRLDLIINPCYKIREDIILNKCRDQMM